MRDAAAAAGVEDQLPQCRSFGTAEDARHRYKEVTGHRGGEPYFPDVRQKPGLGGQVYFFLCCGAIGLLLLAALLVKLFLGGATLVSAGPQKTRLRITNGCEDEPMWVAYMGKTMLDPQNAKLEPLESRDFTIPTRGVDTVRFWSKWRCVTPDGNSCAYGDSGGPGQKCDSSAGCSPPVDTKFEGTFGGQGKPCNTTARQYEGCDFVDVSLKDGYTVPFQLHIKGDCRSPFAFDVEQTFQVVDCTALSLERCPIGEDLRAAGRSESSLKVVNPVWSTLVGCSSPCSKLSYQEWLPHTASRERLAPRGVTPPMEPFCCPTPQDCPMGGAVDQSNYVRAMHGMCPGVNGYAYGMGMGVGTCPAGTMYEMIFYCPTHKAASVEQGEVPAAPTSKPAGGAQVREPQPTRLRVTNGCAKEPMWIAYQAKHMLADQNVRLLPAESHDFEIPGGLGLARYWPKLRCDPTGARCSIGESGGAGQQCDPELGCAPQLDTKLAGIFGLEGKPCDLNDAESAGCDFLDVGLADGYTTPFKLDVYGECRSRFPRSIAELGQTVDCSTLSLEDCPCDEDLGAQDPVSLRVVNPRTNESAGCYSPCSKLTDSSWRNVAVTQQDSRAAQHCCHSPPMLPESCRAGPANRSRYVQAVHKRCPGVYGYVYDDGVRLLTCPAGTRYEMTFYCPAAGPAKCPAPLAREAAVRGPRPGEAV